METAATAIAGIDTTGRLVAAAKAAALAPSIHNTQPWHWRIHGGAADLYADTARQLLATDPDRRLLTLSCGAALHHARTALAASGVQARIDLLPAAGQPEHLARITVTGHHAATEAETRLYQTVPIRHTDRRPLLDQAVNGSDVAAMRKLADGYATGLHPISRSDVLDLAAATSRAQRDGTEDPEVLRELDAWTGGDRPSGAGIPDTSILAEPSETTVPSRDFGHAGTLPVTEGHDRSAMYAILYGVDDEPGSWLRAGEALSAIWLYATVHNIAVLPLSAAVEEAFTRQTLHRMLAGLGYPHLVVRLGIADQTQPAAPPTPRLDAAATIEVVS